jgi:O-antigen/teichoic acid export membrane protein
VARSIIQVAGGTAVAQLIAIAASPLLTRLYSPTDFGVYAAATTIVSLALVVSSLRYSTAIPIPADDETAAQLIALAVICVLVTTASLGLGLGLFGGTVAAALGAPALAPVLWIVVVATLGGGLYEVANRWAVRERAYAAVAKTSIAQAVGMAVGQIGCAVAGAGSAGLVIGDAIGRSSGTAWLTTVMWRRMRAAFGSVGRRGIWRAAVRYRRFPLFSGPGAVVNTLNVLAPTILLLVLYGPATAGMFALAQRVGLLPIRLLGASVAQVYIGELARQVAVDRTTAHVLFRATVRRLAIGGLVPVAGLAIAGPILFPIVFGPEWAEAGLYLTLLAPAYLALFVWNPVSGTLDMLQLQVYGLLPELAGLAIVTVVAFAASSAGVGPSGAVVLLGLATALGTVLALAVSWLVTRNVRDLPVPADPTPSGDWSVLD